MLAGVAVGGGGGAGGANVSGEEPSLWPRDEPLAVGGVSTGIVIVAVPVMRTGLRTDGFFFCWC